MVLSKISLDDETRLDFDMQVSGTNQKASASKLVVTTEDFEIGFKCQPTATGLTVTIPKLKGIAKSGLYEARLEIIIDDKVFVPLTETIEFMPLIECDVVNTKTEKVKEPIGVVVSPIVVRSQTITKSTPTESVKPNLNPKFILAVKAAIAKGMTLEDQFKVG